MNLSSDSSSPYETDLRVAAANERFKAGQDGVVPWDGGKSDVEVFRIQVNVKDACMAVGINEPATRPNLRGFMFASKGIPDISSELSFDAVPD